MAAAEVEAVGAAAAALFRCCLLLDTLSPVEEDLLSWLAAMWCIGLEVLRAVVVVCPLLVLLVPVVVVVDFVVTSGSSLAVSCCFWLFLALDFWLDCGEDFIRPIFVDDVEAVGPANGSSSSLGCCCCCSGFFDSKLVSPGSWTSTLAVAAICYFCIEKKREQRPCIDRDAERRWNRYGTAR